ncbi:MAG: hypothetical protein H0W84_04555 [Bacteroidetes bacterium]|nr:hypothetical protein [Bacteroidota bacterium]
MKKITFCLMMACLSLTFNPNELKANPDSLKTVQNSSEAKALLSRLETFKAMDKSDLSWKEKRELRKEVKSIDQQLRAIGGGIYISVGALLIIIILLIIFL